MTLNEFVTLQFKFDELLKIQEQLIPYVKEAEDYSDDDNIKHLFDKSDEYCFSRRDSYTGCKYNCPFSDWIKSLTETKKRMGEQNYFKSRY